jgi:GNAT superfamily N-acetyltransferase
MEFHIRKAQAADVNALTQLIRGIGWFERFNAEPLDSARDRLAAHLHMGTADDSHSIYVAVGASEELVGYVSVHWLPYLFLPGPEGFVSELFVQETQRGAGIGARLLETVVQEARARGCSRLQLINFRHRESYQRQFYTKQGWEERPLAANFVLRL